MNSLHQGSIAKAFLIFIAAFSVFGSGCMPVVEQDPPPPPPVEPKEEAPPPRLTPDGVTAPALRGEDAIALDDYRGRVVLVDFWATWSAPSLHERPQLAQLYREMRDRGVAVVGFCMDQGDPEELRLRVEALNVPYPVGHADDTLLSAFGGVRAAPTKVLLDRNGQIRHTYAGVENFDIIRNDINALLTK